MIFKIPFMWVVLHTRDLMYEAFQVARLGVLEDTEQTRFARTAYNVT